MMRLQGKVAIITGAGSGIGRATARLFAKEGAKVVVADSNQNTGLETAQQITAEGGEAAFVPVDVARAIDAERMVQTALDSYGRLDILFNNAGVPGESFEETTEEKWRRVIDVNLTGPFLACMYAIPQMKRQGGGSIVNTGSTVSLKATGRSPSYAAAKSGLAMLTRTYANILAKDNIRVNCICPGPIDTASTDAFLRYPRTEEERQARRAASIARVPLGRTGRPEEVASVVLFLASDESSYITGVTLPVDGGILA